MNKRLGPYHLVDLTRTRRAWLNMLDLPGPEHSMYGLLEVDVTAARQYLAAHKARTGETLSFTGFVTYCLARAVASDKSVQACLKDRRQFVVYDDVDVGLMIERTTTTGEKGALTGYVVRRANEKSFLEIHQEIRDAQSTPLPPGRGFPAWLISVMLLPWPLPGLFRTLMGLMGRHDPSSVVSMSGTVGITAVGMFGEGRGGWGIFPMSHTLGLVVGSIAWKPGIVEGRIEPREFLDLTVVFDHDVIDGAPAARFARRLVELLEGAAGLETSPNSLPLPSPEAGGNRGR